MTKSWCGTKFGSEIYGAELGAVDLGVELWQLVLPLGLRTHQHQLC
jgi:hypothetical protein